MSDTSPADALKADLREVLDAVRERAAAEKKLEAELAANEGDPELELQRTLQSIHVQSESELQAAQHEHEVAHQQIVSEFERDYNFTRNEYQAALSEIETQFGTETQAAEREQADARWMVTSVLDDQSHESPRFQFETYNKRLTTTKDRLKEQRQEMVELIQAATEVMARRRQGQDVDEPDAIDPPRNLDDAEERFDAAYSEIRNGHTELLQLVLPRLFAGWWPALLLVLAWSALFLPLYFFVDPAMLKVKSIQDRTSWAVAAAGGSAVVALLGILTVYGVARVKSGRIFGSMHEALAEMKTAHKRWLECGKKEMQLRQKEFERRYAEVVAQRDKALANIDAKAVARLENANIKRKQDLAETEKRYPAFMEEITRRRDDRLRELDKEFQSKTGHVTASRIQSAESIKQQSAELGAERQSKEKRARTAIAQQWLSSTSKFLRSVGELDQQCQVASGDWSTFVADEWKMPSQVQEPIRIGRYDLDFAKIRDGLPQDKQLWPSRTQVGIPFVLPFPARSILFETQGEGRAAAVEAIRSVMLRLLTSFPPGKLRFTVVDPAGLGEEFSAFMHLADYDELLIGTRIWTERAQIDKRLADLSEHMENVFQAYLRNEFETIEEYNEKAGEVAEPYQFLVVANFPANITEAAAQRLVSIATSGPRCGVYTLISVDKKQTFPHSFDLADLEAASITFDWEDGRFVARDPEMAPFPMRVDSPPRANDFAEIVRSVGRQSKDSRRVEVAFERIAPRNGELWKLDSRSGLDVPLGRAGATKLQNLQLGRGTSQHVMIAGKTGSGKSSLLHTLITNLALHYSPDEVQFYLVDFKKGVEFKTYASHNMPHARIIGIESDREFGISVLERLDGVLKERGEMFRNYGVQDIAGYRKACPDKRLPRVLLIIDEFQEFFVEDDSLSQNANLLLDRLVRQGRAFGIHVLLGSQSLGGAYSLARSTLGQVAVRIALQCSEGDAHLILSEENSAARLLTRPGEAIYNDSNGLQEGNHPFQIAWLPDERREIYLDKLHAAVQSQPPQLKLEPAIVFEGNLASDPGRNESIVDAMESFAALSADGNGRSRRALSLWLGEAVSIKPPTRINFERRPAENLLIVGQDTPSAQGILSVSFLTLAAQMKVAEVEDSPFAQFCILDGAAVDADDKTDWTRLAAAVPHKVVRSGQREAAATVAEIAAEVTRRVESGGGDVSPLFVLISNLSRFRDLRNEQDDFGFSSMDSSKGPSAGKQLSDIFKDGPAVGVHSIVWCDSYNNLNRWMSSQTLREFELRVAFQMNANDSSTLIDSPVAARLGGHRALLYLRETGTIEKLRPYAMPSDDWLQWVKAQFNNGARTPLSVSPPIKPAGTQTQPSIDEQSVPP